MKHQYNLRIDIPIEAETAEEAVRTLVQWMRDREDLFQPVVEINPGEYTEPCLIDTYDFEDEE
jgi:hypothetical protein